MPSSKARWPPRSPSQPIRGRRRRSSGRRRARAANDASPASESGARASWPAWTSSRSARSRTLRAIGPSVPNCVTQTSRAGTAGTRPRLGLKPKTLFHAAGLRRLPIESLPSATGSMPQRDRDAGAAAAAAGRLRRVVGVAGRAEHFVEGVRAEPELGRVGLADDDAPGRLHSLHEERVAGRDEVAQQRRAERRPQPGGRDHVLDRLRQAEQDRRRRVARIARASCGIAAVGLAQQRRRRRAG